MEVIGFTDTTKVIEQPESPEVDFDSAGNIATTRIYAIRREHVANYLAGISPTDSDPIYTDAKIRGIRVSSISSEFRMVSVRYEPDSWGYALIGPVGTTEQEADANALITPVDIVAPDSPGVEAIKADGLDGKLEPQPVYRYRKVKSSFTWTEENIVSGVGKLDDAPAEMVSPSSGKWLMTEHSVQEAGGVVQEEWGWQFADNGWNANLYTTWTGEAS